LAVSGRPSIALASREIAPFGGGGIGTYWTAAAEALCEVADVTVFTTDHHRAAYERFKAAGDRRVSFAPVVFVAEPRSWEVGETDSALSLWSARLFEALCAAYPDGGPDLVEFPDFLGEAFVTAQARRADDPRIARTTICVRGCTTSEMTHVLDGHLSDEFGDLLTQQIERYALAHCDHFLWAGGDVLGTYERFFGPEAIAAPVRVRHPLFGHAAEPAAAEEDGDLLRLLFVGRLERRKGVLDLARAISGIADERLRVTFLGGDTETAPLGQSVRTMLELIVGDDPRVTLVEELPRERLPELVAAHDAVVLPSLWECWPAVALEALERDRPILATPTGGFVEIVDESSGWLTDGVGAEPLAVAIERLLAEPEAVAALRGSGRPRARFAELTDVDQVRSGYLALAAERPPVPAPLAERPLVSVVIPYFRLEEFIEEAVRSVEAQTYPEIETVIVNDGSLRPADRILEPLAERYGATVITQVNSGLGAARNTGVVHARGRYVMFLDADNVLRPRFIERCVEVLERHPGFAYATAWARYVNERGEQWQGSQHEYRALGNWTPLVHRRNVAGDAAAVFRRDVFTRGLHYGQELTSFEDWALYRLMHELGLIGTVVPERLLEYRIRDKSMLRQIGAPNQDRIEGEIRAWIEEMRMQWTPPRA
jgi:glycosyltransferase involved in cell wall biosynthesis